MNPFKKLLLGFGGALILGLMCFGAYEGYNAIHNWLFVPSAILTLIVAVILESYFDDSDGNVFFATCGIALLLAAPYTLYNTFTHWSYSWGGITPGDVKTDALNTLKAYYTPQQIQKFQLLGIKKADVPTGPFTSPMQEWRLKLRGPEGVTSCLYMYVDGNEWLNTNFYRPCNTKTPISYKF